MHFKRVRIYRRLLKEKEKATIQLLTFEFFIIFVDFRNLLNYNLSGYKMVFQILKQ